MKRYAKSSYAAPLRFRVIVEKPQGGGGQDGPPAVRGLILQCDTAELSVLDHAL